ncbi:hypothetical protein RHSIM_Rhsim11G0072800 [Rhododendron simsii]|uniref:Uncharacterized protein n=1 Tax=Rhododendron simsii TaxID=118357 RepID=A0A834G6S0_RHOSS|nr:hypothetical protein RHSIM_Rhsim11G0072800 [Rhododendron simsii]
MEAKVVGARGGREATEGKAANPIARAARTRSAFTSLVPPKRKLIKKMMWDSMVQAIVVYNGIDGLGYLMYLDLEFAFSRGICNIK